MKPWAPELSFTENIEAIQKVIENYEAALDFLAWHKVSQSAPQQVGLLQWELFVSMGNKHLRAGPCNSPGMALLEGVLWLKEQHEEENPVWPPCSP